MLKRTPFYEKLDAAEGEVEQSNIVELPNADGLPEKYTLSYRITNREELERRAR